MCLMTGHCNNRLGIEQDTISYRGRPLFQSGPDMFGRLCIVPVLEILRTCKCNKGSRSQNLEAGLSRSGQSYINRWRPCKIEYRRFQGAAKSTDL
jgi:hypothetical protein